MGGSHQERHLVLSSEEQLAKVAAFYATDKNEVLFTTLNFRHKGVHQPEHVELAKHLWQNLKEIGRLDNTLLLTYDSDTYNELAAAGIPAWLDKLSPQPSTLVGQYATDVPHWYQKYHFALQLLKLNFTAVFLEVDMVFLQDPLPHAISTSNDIEGFSDWWIVDIPSPKERYLAPCTIYHMYKADHGEQYITWGQSDDEDPRKTRHVNPCMSTGFWFARPSQATEEFFTDFIELISSSRNAYIDQLVWNEIWYWRNIKGLNKDPYKDPVMLHCGGVPADKKVETIKNNRMWRGDDWNPQSAADFTAALFERFHTGPHRHLHQPH